MMKKALTIIGVIAITAIMVSTATAVLTTNSQTEMEQLDKIKEYKYRFEELEILDGPFDDLLDWLNKVIILIVEFFTLFIPGLIKGVAETIVAAVATAFTILIGIPIALLGYVSELAISLVKIIFNLIGYVIDLILL